MSQVSPPEMHPQWEPEEQSRRDFLKYMGASLALAGITACTKMPLEEIIPYIVAPEKIIPGRPLYFASSSLFSGYAKGILVESHEGRPTKIEGSHFGATDIFSQAEILTLYDPDRSKSVKHLGQISTWDAFAGQMTNFVSKWKLNEGEGFRILTETLTSPTLAHQFHTLLQRYPKAKLHSYEPVHSDSMREGALLAFGKEVRPLFSFDQAKVILSLDADFLGPGPAQEAYARSFVKSRSPGTKSLRTDSSSINRLYMADSSVTLTGANADYRLPLTPSQIEGLALAIAHQLDGSLPITAPDWTNQQAEWISGVSQELRAHPGQSLVVAGQHQSSVVHLLAHVMNEHLGNSGKTVHYIHPIEINPVSQARSLLELKEDLSLGKVDTLLILGGNPVYATPASVSFKEQLSKAKLRIHLGLYEDETAFECHWHLPQAHFLEAWGDARTYDGTVGLQQPLISPLYTGRSYSEVLSIFLGQPGFTSRQALSDYWKSQLSLQGQSFEKYFETAIHDGVISDSMARPVSVQLRSDWKVSLDPSLKSGPVTTESLPDLEIVFLPDPTIWDGRYSNNGWLQELPKPLLQLTWDNAVILSPSLASRLGLEDEDQVELRLYGRVIQGPILRIPGHPDHSVTVYLGYGKTRGSDVGLDEGRSRGFNAYELWSQSPAQRFSKGLSIRKLGNKVRLATTQSHHSMEGRSFVRHGQVEDYLKDPESVVPAEVRSELPSALSRFPYTEEAWGMVIDLGTCIGCNVCTIACQAENNIPIVGKDQVWRAREMHWIRVDRYFEGGSDNPKVYFQPVPCMHCETAPCELVCPTGATNHSSDGLNQMIYNRCVGTRYCSNNCPYKVRRFNFYPYSDMTTPLVRQRYNPDVTVRSRGVMEKCTYCIQRIERVRIDAEIDDRPIRDGEVVPACAAACPTSAIFFGNQNDRESQVHRLKRLPLNYSLLHTLGTKPRTTYLAKLSNSPVNRASLQPKGGRD